MAGLGDIAALLIPEIHSGVNEGPIGNVTVAVDSRSVVARSEEAGEAVIMTKDTRDLAA